ncbi:MAG TPA: thioredoxin domain-containing protein [Patescibacteria group bacterium]|nr:thioredoxin domain-containing protein [Patescibacteria group bacterium]
MLIPKIVREYLVPGIVLVMLLLVAVACGEIPVPEQVGDSVLSENTQAENDGGATSMEPDSTTIATDTAEPKKEPAKEDSASTGIAVKPTATVIDFEGIEVGFTEDGHPYRGNPDAPTVIKEYSDYQCPFCARFYEQTYPSLILNQIATGEAVLLYYDFPLTKLHPQAYASANAARCAGEQGADSYWAMHNLLFANSDQWANSEAETVFMGFAEDLELNVDDYEKCVSEQSYSSEIDADLQSGRALGISGTPTFVINGQLLVGAQPLAVFENAITTIGQGGQLASNEPDPQPNQPQAAPTPAAILSDYAATLGDPNAPVTIIEFTDYQCPYCSRHSLDTLPRIISEMVDTGRVFYAQKDLPLDQLHPNARIAASAARCAADQDAYWEMHDTLFTQQSEWAEAGSSVNELFVSYATGHGLDDVAFSDCLESGQHDAAVEANAQEANSLGISGTPFFFVDGYPLNGARPYEHFELAVQYAEEGRLAEAYAPQPQQQPQQPQQPAGPVDIPIDDGLAIGNANAPITIVEYTDFQCPFCSRHFSQTYPQILEEYVNTGVVRYVFKDFPLNSIHPQAAEAAEAARCAGDQGRYLDMHDLLFLRQTSWSGQSPTNIFISFAQDLGLDADAFDECLASGIYTSAVDADLQEGIQFGVTGTPAFFINGYPVSGAQPFAVFQQAIESLLAEN